MSIVSLKIKSLQSLLFFKDIYKKKPQIFSKAQCAELLVFSSCLNGNGGNKCLAMKIGADKKNAHVKRASRHSHLITT